MTGATGFLGSSVAKKLLEAGDDVHALKRPSSKFDRLAEVVKHITWLDLESLAIENVFTSRKFEAVLHCATNYGLSNVDPIRTIEANLILPIQLLHAAAKSGVGKFLNTDTVLDKRITHYALSKHQFKEWLKSYENCICAINLALQHFYGPADDDSKFVTSIIKRLLAKEREIELTLGEQTRDFIYIDDVAEACCTALKAGASRPGYCHYEVGSGTPVSIRNLVELAAEIVGGGETSLNFGALPYRDFEVMRVVTDTSEIEALGWKPKTSLIDGLKKTIIQEKSRLYG